MRAPGTEHSANKSGGLPPSQAPVPSRARISTSRRARRSSASTEARSTGIAKPSAPDSRGHFQPSACGSLQAKSQANLCRKGASSTETPPPMGGLGYQGPGRTVCRVGEETDVVEMQDCHGTGNQRGEVWRCGAARQSVPDSQSNSRLFWVQSRGPPAKRSGVGHRQGFVDACHTTRFLGDMKAWLLGPHLLHRLDRPPLASLQGPSSSDLTWPKHHPRGYSAPEQRHQKKK